MFTLDIEYLSYICQKSLTVNNQLLNLYNEYAKNCSLCEDLSDDYNDNTLNEFLISLIDDAEYWTDVETAMNIDSRVLSYNRQRDLIQYIYNINNIMKEHRTILDKSFINYPSLVDCQLEDSRMTNLLVDNKRHICNIILDNVLLYGEKRIDKSIPVDCGTAVLIFNNTKKVEIKGEIITEDPDVNLVYKWHIMEKSEKLLSFCLLLLIGNRSCIVQIACSDIEIEING